jgi:MFS family permease
MNEMSGKPSSLSVFAIYAMALLAEGAGTVVIPLWVLSLNPTPTMFGIVIGAKGLLPLLFSIHGGVLMDRFGAARILQAASLIGFFLPILFPLLPNLWAALVLHLSLCF